PCPVSQQKLRRDIISLPLSRGYALFELDWRACFDHLAVVRAHRLRNIPGMYIEVGFTANLIALNMMAPFVFPVYQQITEFEILHKNDGRGVVHYTFMSAPTGKTTRY